MYIQKETFKIDCVIVGQWINANKYKKKNGSRDSCDR